MFCVYFLSHTHWSGKVGAWCVTLVVQDTGLARFNVTWSQLQKRREECHIKHYSHSTYIHRVKNVLSLSYKLPSRPSDTVILHFCHPKKQRERSLLMPSLRLFILTFSFSIKVLRGRQYSTSQGRNPWQNSLVPRQIQISGIRLSYIKLLCSGLKKPDRHTGLTMMSACLSLRNGDIIWQVF
jgi:hypothetical protein